MAISNLRIELEEMEFYIASRLNKAVKESGLAIKEISRITGINNTTRIHHFMNRITKVPLSFLVIFAKKILKQKDIKYFTKGFDEYLNLVNKLSLTEKQTALSTPCYYEKNSMSNRRIRLSPVDRILNYIEKKAVYE